MTKKIWALPLIAVALALAGCGGDDDGNGEAADEGSVTVQLAEQNGSGQSGTATLTAEGEQTRVTIELDNPPADAQPAHIHKGSCDELDPSPAYPLDDVENGTSESIESVSLDELKSGSFAVNVHKSASEASTYVACGDIGSGSGGGGDTDSGEGY